MFQPILYLVAAKLSTRNPRKSPLAWINKPGQGSHAQGGYIDSSESSTRGSVSSARY
jgi:hypothetical protein